MTSVLSLFSNEKLTAMVEFVSVVRETEPASVARFTALLKYKRVATVLLLLLFKAILPPDESNAVLLSSFAELRCKAGENGSDTESVLLFLLHPKTKNKGLSTKEKKLQFILFILDSYKISNVEIECGNDFASTALPLIHKK